VRRLSPAPLHAERIRHRRKMFTEASEIEVEIFGPNSTRISSRIGVFFGVRNVAMVPVREVRNRRDFAFASGQPVRRLALFFTWPAPSGLMLNKLGQPATTLLI
jgi:hypothetical protein